MGYKEFVELMKQPDKHYLVTMGAGSLTKRFGLELTRREIKAAKKEAREGFTGSTKGTKFPKILVFDIETSPSIAYAFGRFKQNIYLDQVIQDPIMLTWSAKWLYSTDIMSDAITVDEVRTFNDYRIVKSLWNLMDEADIVIAHYGDNFDIPMLNSRAVINGLNPFSTLNSIDTKRIASRTFRFPSNKLDAIASYFKVGNKIKTEFSLWSRCLQGEQAAIDEMETYNIQDVVILEDVYLKLRPWAKGHPNLGVYMDKSVPVCHLCGSEEITPTGRTYATNANKYLEYRCKCGGLSRGRSGIVDKDIRKTLLTNVLK